MSSGRLRRRQGIAPGGDALLSLARDQAFAAHRARDRAPARGASTEAARPRWLDLLDSAGFGALALAAAWALLRVDAAALPAAWPAAAALAALAGLLTADLLSGVVHWLGDTFFEPETPLVGAWLIAPFREHHRDPTAITRHGVLEVGGSSALAVAPLIALTGWLAGRGGSAACTVAVFALALGLAAVATNPIHRWAHAAQPPRFVAWLQRRGLILSPAHHARHHAGGHRRAYCVTTGWLNPLLDGTRVFAHLERCVRRARRAPGR